LQQPPSRGAELRARLDELRASRVRLVQAGDADAARGLVLRGLADRVAALDATLSLESPPGRSTRLHAEIPCNWSATSLW
jgi:hypothetical protein